MKCSNVTLKLHTEKGDVWILCETADGQVTQDYWILPELQLREIHQKLPKRKYFWFIFIYISN